ncbi:serine/threonine-protein kinase [Nonomuraea antri]|uniref:serine/threonine-protein kinase n=1 Tax=Nonomuraea antri TaxID=2730852 RepID=UPI001F15B106|nr:serine/threonine-protein kinase [Nonomuraea antri]
MSIPARPGDGWSFNPPPGWTVPEGWEPPADWEGPDPGWPAAPPYWLWWKEAELPVPPSTDLTGAGPSPLERGDPPRIGEYRLAGRLGSGGMGIVYAGVDRAGRRVAVKVVHPAFAGEAEFRARFARESAVLTRVAGACVARVVAADTRAARPWLATEYVPGPTLDAYIRRYGPLTGDALYGLAAGLAEAIVAIHDAGVVHRDLKPANVILSPQGPRVVDFGIARALDETAMTRTGMVVGSPGWISPEEYGGTEAGPAADVHNWALLVAYAASGKPPFGAGRPEVLAARVLGADADTSDLPTDLRALTDRALAKDPQLRPDAHALLRLTTECWGAFQDDPAPGGFENPATEVVTRLERTWAPAGPAETPWEAAPRGRTSRMLWAASATIATVAIAAVVASSLPSSGGQPTAAPPQETVVIPATPASATPSASPSTSAVVPPPLTIAALDKNRLLAFDATTGALIREITLPVEKVTAFAFDTEDATLYLRAEQYSRSRQAYLGSRLYRMGADGTARFVARTGRDAELGGFAASNGTVAYTSSTIEMFEQTTLHIVTARSARRIELGAYNVTGLSVTSDGRVGISARDASGVFRARVLPPDAKGFEDSIEIISSDSNSCELSGITWGNDKWIAIETGSLAHERQCRENAHIVDIDEDLAKVSKIGPAVSVDADTMPGDYALQVDPYGRIYGQTSIENRHFIVEDGKVRNVKKSRYRCAKSQKNCLRTSGLYFTATPS